MTIAGPQVRFDFDGRVVLVTGGGSGIGRATAMAFAAAGAAVAVVDIDAARAQAVALAIEAEGGSGIAITCDVSKGDDVTAMVRAVTDRFGRLDYAFNNAGGTRQLANLVDLTEAQFDALVGLQLRGTWLCMKHEIPAMIAAGGGAIVNAGSAASVRGGANIAHYAASKAGLSRLTQSAALEFGERGIRANAVLPGPIRTATFEAVTTGRGMESFDLAAGLPVGRLGLPEDIASAVLFLCSDAASFITGHELIVDGGRLIR